MAGNLPDVTVGSVLLAEGNWKVDVKYGRQFIKEVKNIMLFLQGHRVSAGFAVKLYKACGNESIGTVKENPFCLADDIWGIGLKICA